MTTRKRIPKNVYKYRAFNAVTMQSLVADEVYFADPTTFNDPLDTKPTVKADLEVGELEQVLRTLIEWREEAELGATAWSISYRGPKTVAHVQRMARNRASEELKRLEYLSQAPDATSPFNAHRWLLAEGIEDELLKRYGKGILSLGTNFANPLLWSHYGDQHKGLCIGYSVPEGAKHSIFEVKYGGSRIVKTSSIAAMLTGDEVAQRAVDASVLLQKASDWAYEEEWRLLGQRGIQRSPLELTDVTFGMRCAEPVKHAVVRALADRDSPVEFYEVRVLHGTFTLRRYPVDIEELRVSYPARSIGLLEDFEDISE